MYTNSSTSLKSNKKNKCLSIKIAKEILHTIDFNCTSDISALRKVVDDESQTDIDRSELLITYLYDEYKSSNRTIERLCDQLYGHVEFLERLYKSQQQNKTQYDGTESLFLISQMSGNTFLANATRDMLLEQASRTTELLSTLVTSPESPMYSVSKTMNFSFDPSLRTSTLKTVFSKKDDYSREIRKKYTN